ncbi:hypothetical protein AAG570_004466 [Ranatra chinensis]|uniref:Uncharacterized protein n=1 Tax=Ranatra chinensis TaxID=642074 RepID=A0ABD0YDK5_9HEMI
MASKRRTFHQNKKQETTEIDHGKLALTKRMDNCSYPQSLKAEDGSNRRNYQSEKQETTEIDLPPVTRPVRETRNILNFREQACSRRLRREARVPDDEETVCVQRASMFLNWRSVLLLILAAASSAVQAYHMGQQCDWTGRWWDELDSSGPAFASFTTP